MALVYCKLPSESKVFGLTSDFVIAYGLWSLLKGMYRPCVLH